MHMETLYKSEVKRRNFTHMRKYFTSENDHVDPLLVQYHIPLQILLYAF